MLSFVSQSMRLRPGKELVNFQSGHEESDLILDVVLRDPAVDLSHLSFDSGGLWTLHKDGRRDIFRFRTPHQDPTEVIEVAPDWRRGIINCPTDAWRGRSDYVITYPLDELMIVNLLARQGGALLHSSAVVTDEGGFLFAGMSGAGKSTMASLWKRYSDAEVLSDDRVIVREADDGTFWVYGTPWHGTAHIASPGKAPLRGIYLIHHDDVNGRRPLSVLEATSGLVARSFPPLWDAEWMEATLAFLERLSGVVPCFEMGFVPDASAVAYVNA